MKPPETGVNDYSTDKFFTAETQRRRGSQRKGVGEFRREATSGVSCLRSTPAARRRWTRDAGRRSGGRRRRFAVHLTGARRRRGGARRPRRDPGRAGGTGA